MRLGSEADRPSPCHLLVFAFGLQAEPDDIRYAETLAFVALAASELPLAFTARSERYSLLRIGILGNRTMVYAVASSFALLLTVIYVPFLQGAFKTVPLTLDDWAMLLPLVFIPAVAAEITKWGQRLRREGDYCGEQSPQFRRPDDSSSWARRVLGRHRAPPSE
jgi:magnesium-transporting ATPase (P-type)